MAKNVDLDFIVGEIAGSMTGQASLLSKVAIQSTEPTADIDLYAEMDRRAALVVDSILDDAHKSVDMKDLGVKVLTSQDRQKEVLRSLGLEKRAKLSVLAAELTAIAARADAEGFRKQAADLRFAASKMV
jgi:hypothetical protein